MTEATIEHSPSHLVYNGGITVEEVKNAIVDELKFTLARIPETATEHDWMIATSKAVQDLIIDRFLHTMGEHTRQNARRVYYMSLEFLMGRMLTNNMYAVGCHEQVEQALKELGEEFDSVVNEEYDMALGNGGLGRLAACFLDSMATLDLPAVGYGIRYEFGLFRQDFENGHQVEHPDRWIKYGNVWDICHPEYSQTVHLYGELENVFDDNGRYQPKWVNTKPVIGVPYDIPIAGFGTETVNFLRLWESQPVEDIDLEKFNQGGYVEAVSEKTHSESISKVLYPNDTTESGKELRLVQQYFFVACSIQDIIRRHHSAGNNWDNFADKVVMQLNDTHPAIAVVELMRILHDEADKAWEEAWAIVTKVFAYTNHTLLPEALETWSVPLMTRVLPRHVQIIFEINRRHMLTVAERYPGDMAKQSALSIIQEGHPKRIRMACLSVVGSFSVNGVAALHTELLKANLFKDFEEFFPGRINNKTNGITPRRWLYACNPGLTQLIGDTIGMDWVTDLDRLHQLEEYADDPAFQEKFMAIKHENKVRLASIIEEECGVTVSPDAIFDVQIKRLHEYKRQHLKLLYILTLYKQLLENPDMDIAPRVFIFGAKAAPGYYIAKLIIKAINSAAKVINQDERIKGKLKVVFMPNYRVSLASKIIPAADVSEQISTAGKEASGTGNMKLALNGAVTIGTLDGANVEIRDEVGDENIFIFGNTVEEVQELRDNGYEPYKYYNRNDMLRTVVDWVGSNFFTPDEPGILNDLKKSLLDHGDPFMVMADYADYCRAQTELDLAYQDKKRWARMAILNTARVGKFSSDRTISEYAKDIWKLEPVKVS